MAPHPPTILIIGGPDNAKCYSGDGITRVPYHPLEVLKLGHLYEYDVVIFWPSWFDNFELNMTKGELRKACPAFVTYQDIMSEQYPQGSSGPKDGDMPIDLDGLPSPESLCSEVTKSNDGKKKAKSNAPKVPPFDVTKDLPDSDMMVDHSDYIEVEKLFNAKLLEIMAGISQRQLAFIIIPTNYGGQSPGEIIGWMKLPILFDLDTNRTDRVSFTATGQHPIYAIMRGMTSIVKEWDFHFIASPSKEEYNNHTDQSDIDIVIQIPLNDYALTIRDVHATVRAGHTDRGGGVRSLMILSEQGGLAVIPKPESIDEFVSLITSSISAAIEPSAPKPATIDASVPKPVVVESPASQLAVLSHNEDPKRSLVLTADRDPEVGNRQQWKIFIDGKAKLIPAGQFSKVLILVLAKLLPDNDFGWINGFDPTIRGKSVRNLLKRWPKYAFRVYQDVNKAIGHKNLIRDPSRKTLLLKEDWRALNFTAKEIDIIPLFKVFCKHPMHIYDSNIHNLLKLYKNLLSQPRAKK